MNLEQQVYDLDLSLLEWLYPRLLYYKNFKDYGLGTPSGISRNDWKEIIDELIIYIGLALEFTTDQSLAYESIAYRMIGEYGTKLWV